MSNPDKANRVGNAVRSAREVAGVTQTELASKVGISQPRISALERGESAPSLVTLKAIEKALGLERGFLLRAAGEVKLPGGTQVDAAEITNRLQSAMNELSAVALALGYRMVPLDEDE